jgi:hypothetical protein
MLDLKGSVTCSRSLLDDEVWTCEKFGRGQAYWDLVMLANDKPRQVFINDHPVSVLRGQLAWSLGGLGERWKWSPEKVTGFLRWLDVRGKIQFNPSHVVTIITIQNYDIYQLGTVPDQQPPLEPATGTATAPATAPVAGTATDTATGTVWNGKREREIPSVEACEIPTEGDVRAEAEAYPGSLVKGIPPGMPFEWWNRWHISAMSRRGGFNWKFWRTIMKQAFETDFAVHLPHATANLEKKTTLGMPMGDGRTPAQARFEISRELEEVKSRLESAFTLDIKPDPEDEKKERELELKLRKLE